MLLNNLHGFTSRYIGVSEQPFPSTFAWTEPLVDLHSICTSFETHSVVSYGPAAGFSDQFLP